MCNESKVNGTTCKAELKKRLKRVLKILDAMEGDVFTEDEHKLAIEADELLEHVRDFMPDVQAWCTVKHYGSPGFSGPVVWDAHTSREDAETETALTQAHYKKDHDEHPWWGPWEKTGDRFKVESRVATVHALRNGMKKKKVERTP